MLILTLHGSLDFHDGLAVVVVALTLLMGSVLSTLRQRMTQRRDDARRPEEHAVEVGG